jgi:hypothetical protein
MIFFPDLPYRGGLLFIELNPDFLAVSSLPFTAVDTCDLCGEAGKGIFLLCGEVTLPGIADLCGENGFTTGIDAFGDGCLTTGIDAFGDCCLTTGIDAFGDGCLTTGIDAFGDGCLTTGIDDCLTTGIDALGDRCDPTGTAGCFTGIDAFGDGCLCCEFLGVSVFDICFGVTGIVVFGWEKGLTTGIDDVCLEAGVSDKTCLCVKFIVSRFVVLCREFAAIGIFALCGEFCLTVLLCCKTDFGSDFSEKSGSGCLLFILFDNQEISLFIFFYIFESTLK